VQQTESAKLGFILFHRLQLHAAMSAMCSGTLPGKTTRGALQGEGIRGALPG
jgi:hypothetical protein